MTSLIQAIRETNADEFQAILKEMADMAHTSADQSGDPQWSRAAFHIRQAEINVSNRSGN